MANDLGGIAELITAIAKTPLPTLLLLLGFVMLSVGFGLEITVVFNVEHMSKAYAKMVGAVLFIIGLGPHIAKYVLPKTVPESTRARDPWLVYYVFSMLFVVALCWSAMKFTAGEMQISAMMGSFRLVGGLATVAVLWRGFAVYFYLRTPGRNNVPFDLYERHNYLPYFGIVGAGVLAILWIIYQYTQEQSEIGNRVVLYGYFVELCAYLILCRLAWECADWIAKTRASRSQP